MIPITMTMNVGTAAVSVASMIASTDAVSIKMIHGANTARSAAISAIRAKEDKMSKEIGPKEAQQRLLAKQKREHLNANKPSICELRTEIAKVVPKTKTGLRKKKR